MRQASPYAYDLFISYARADLAWVHGYLLPSLGLPPERVITEQGFAEGVARVAEFEQAIQQSRLTVLIYSPAFPANEWTDFSEKLASHLAVATQRERVALLLLQPCEIPLRLQPRFRLDFTDAAQWQHGVAQLRDLLNLPEPSPEDIPCPYPGMVPFRQEDARRFFGRDEEIEALTQRLGKQSLILVMGPSGSGKSSLLSAGLIPTLPQGWTHLSMRPGVQPFSTLRLTLAAIAGANEYLAGGPQPAVLPGERTLLIVDQLEELFVQPAELIKTADDEQRIRFIDAINRLRQCPGWTVILALRADFFSDLMNSPLWPFSPEQRLEVTALRGESLRPVIQRPANDLKVHLEVGLIEKLIADSADEPGVLPLLQQTMVSLWEKRRRRLLPLNAYRAMGDGQRSGMATAVATKADETMAQLAAEDQLVAQRVFVRLVAFGEGRADTRRQQPILALLDAASDRARTLRVIRHLAQHRLLTLGEKDGEQQTVDIAHDVLITGWPAFGEWLRKWRAAELTRRRLQAKAEEWAGWVAAGQPNTGLLDSAELAEAEQWLSGAEAAQFGYSPTLRAFVDKSQADLRRSLRIRIGVIGALIALVMAVLVAITVGQSQLATQRSQAAATAESLAQAEARARSTAESEVVVRATAEARAVSEAAARATAQAIAEQRRQEAETSSQFALARQLAAQAEQIIDQDPHALTKALLLAVESVRRAQTFEGDQALRRGLSLQPSLVFKMAVAPADLYSSQDIGALAFSPDGRWLAVGTHGEIISVRDTATWREVFRVQAASISGIVPSVRALAFCPNSRRLISGGDGRFVQAWDVTTGQELAHMNHDGQVFSVACAPDSSMAASGTGTEVIAWEPDTGDVVYKVGAPSSAITFDPAGKLAAAAGGDTVVVWEAKTGITLTQITPIADREPGDLNSLRALAFSPDGRFLAVGEGGSTGGWAEPRQPLGGRIWVFEATTGREIAHMTHTDEVLSLDFSPDGKWLASGGFDGAARVWDAPTGQMIGEYDFGAPVRMVAFMQQGAWLAAIGLENLARIWDVRTGREVGRMTTASDAQLLQLATLDTPRLVAAGDERGVVYVWGIGNEGETTLSHGNTRSISWLELSSDGQRLVTGSYDRAARVWDSNTGEEISRVDHDARVLLARFSPDGRIVASSSQDGELKVWEAATGVETIEIPDLKAVSSIEFSPDGRLLAAGEGTFPRDGWFLDQYGPRESGPGSVYIWELSTGREVMRLEHDRLVNSIAFSPDGRWLASGSDDRRARVWDVATGREIASHEHPNRVNLVTFAPDGKVVVSAEACFQTFFGSGIGQCNALVSAWEAASGKLIWRDKEQGRWISQLVFSSDKKLVATANEHLVRVRDARTGRVIAEMNHDDDIVIGLAFSPDGRLIASGGGPSLGEGAVRVWDPITGIESLRIPYGQAWTLDFSEDGSRLAVGGFEAGETAARIYSLDSENLIAAACSRATRNLTQAEWRQYLNGQPFRETCPDLPQETLQPDGPLTQPFIAADGRHIVFVSAASNLVCDDSNLASDVFIYDLQTEDISRIPTGAGGQEANGPSIDPSISAGGRYVLFSSDASNLIGGDTNGAQDVFRYDQVSGAMLLVSRAPGDAPADGYSSALAISDDGQRMLFASLASNLASGDTDSDIDGEFDLFLFLSGTPPTLARVPYTGTGRIREGSISADGRVVAFSALASTDNAETAAEEAFVYDLDTGVVAPLPDTDLERTHDPSQIPSNTYLSHISADGRYVTGTKNLVGSGGSDEYELFEVYLIDRVTGQATYVSVAPDGALGNRDSGAPKISENGRYVVFDSESTNLVSNDTNVAWDVFVFDRQTGGLSRISVAFDGAQPNGHSTSPTISGDGRFVAFTSTATNLVPDDTNNHADVFIYDRLLKQTTRIVPSQTDCP